MAVNQYSFVPAGASFQCDCRERAAAVGREQSHRLADRSGGEPLDFQPYPEPLVQSGCVRFAARRRWIVALWQFGTQYSSGGWHRQPLLVVYEDLRYPRAHSYAVPVGCIQRDQFAAVRRPHQWSRQSGSGEGAIDRESAQANAVRFEDRVLMRGLADISHRLKP